MRLLTSRIRSISRSISLFKLTFLRKDGFEPYDVQLIQSTVKIVISVAIGLKQSRVGGVGEQVQVSKAKSKGD
jgi:hypothetical protein